MTHNIVFRASSLTPDEQAELSKGFERHSQSQQAPDYEKQRVSWVVPGDSGQICAAATADVLWDWLYVDEIWVDESSRGSGLGRALIQEVEVFAADNALVGVWLWTQSWQAEGFYERLGYEPFARFDDFPRGFARTGYRKRLPGSGSAAD